MNMSGMKQARIRTTASLLSIVLWASGAMQVRAEAPLLDTLSVPAAGAYGLRKLRSAYAGPAIEVRRSSDNTTAKIGFAENGELDVEALLKFAGEGNGSVKTWYDQSGNTRDAGQSNPARQRLIVEKGKLVVFPGTQKPALSRGEAGESFATKNAMSKGEILRATSVVFYATPVVAPATASIAYACGDGCPNLFVENNCLWFDNGGKDAIKGAVSVLEKGVVATYVNPRNDANKRAGYMSGSLVGESDIKLKNCHFLQASGWGTREEGKWHGHGFSGYFAELVYFDKDITAPDREKLEGSHAWRFGLEKNLPDAHPHKKSAPK
jgi:hypothetical protein